MNDHHLKTLGQVRAFLDGTEAVEFSLDSKVETLRFYSPHPHSICLSAFVKAR